ncbi:MAG: head GIN domain-containing protein [Saprospiraceae bacterium]
MIKNMQKVPALIFLALLTWTFSACDDVLGIKGKGDLVTEVRDVKNFHAVDIATNGQLELRVDSVFHVEVTCEESIIPYLVTLNDNGTLKIHFDRDVYDVDNLKITVSAPAWAGVEISGSVNVDVPDAISGDKLDLRISGSGNMKIFNANFNEIQTLITGSGDISIDGIADHLKCTISGSGNLDALGCPVLTADVTITGSGDVRLEVSESLQVTISGSGNVEYRGNPSLNSSISGSGKVRKI